MAGMSTASSSSSSEHVTVPVDKDQQHRGTEAVFHLNPTEPHSYQVLEPHHCCCNMSSYQQLQLFCPLHSLLRCPSGLEEIMTFLKNQKNQIFFI